MSPSPHVEVRIDLARIRDNAAALRDARRTRIIAVVKADAYGHGAGSVVPAIADVVDGFYVFSLAEAAAAGVAATGKPTLVLNPDRLPDPDAFLSLRARPAVWDEAAARSLRRAGPAVCVDAGMQRFAVGPASLADVIRAGGCEEAFAHCTKPGEVERFVGLLSALPPDLRAQLRTRHVAGTSLLADPAAQFDAIRPGLALYRGAARVTARLVEVRETRGPVGYTGWQSNTGRHGLIVAGYLNGLRPGPCVVNGHPRRIAEVGMQSAFVELGPGDRPGDEVVLLGDDLDAAAIAQRWGTSPQEVLVRMGGMGRRGYVQP